MKLRMVLIFSLLSGLAQAQSLTITDVRVTATGDSSASAREKALKEAHEIAFQKLLNQHLPEVNVPPPSHENIVDMVTNFSIDREKTTSKSYTASLTFEFDGTQVQAWALGPNLSEEGKAEHEFLPSLKGHELNVEVSYASLQEWRRIKEELKSTPGVLKVTLLSLSPKMASLKIAYGDDPSKLQKLLNNQGWLLAILFLILFVIKKQTNFKY